MIDLLRQKFWVCHYNYVGITYLQVYIFEKKKQEKTATYVYDANEYPIMELNDKK